MFFSFGCEAAGIGGFDGDNSKTASVAVKSRACEHHRNFVVFVSQKKRQVTKQSKFRGATFGSHRRDRFYSRHYYEAICAAFLKEKLLHKPA
jgi:hypothetical protein